MGDSVVLEALRAATSQDPELLKRGENLLKSWEGQAGFYRTLSVLYKAQLYTITSPRMHFFLVKLLSYF